MKTEILDQFYEASHKMGVIRDSLWRRADASEIIGLDQLAAKLTELGAMANDASREIFQAVIDVQCTEIAELQVIKDRLQVRVNGEGNSNG